MSPILESDWFPVSVHRDDRDRWLVDWRRLGEERFTDPYFDQTVRRCLDLPFNLAPPEQTPLDELPESDPNAAALRGLIFHLSRCGSTLISQTFAANPETIVIAEASPVDDVLRASRFQPDVADDWRVARLRAVVSALGRKRHPGERSLVVKFDAWNALDLALVERAFPGVPWFFVYREPIEILVSHDRIPSWFMSAVNAPSLLGLSLLDTLAIPQEERYARILGQICDAVAERGVPADRLLSYAELPEAIERRIAPVFGLTFGDAERAVARRDAKQPDRPFAPDAQEKRLAASRTIRDAVQRFARAPYDRLEAIRIGPQGNRGAPMVLPNHG